MRLLLALALSAASVDAAGAGEALAVVAHAEWQGLESISLPVLRQLYLGRRTRLAGERVQCLDLPAGGGARTAFTRTVLGSSERALDRYWLRQALGGGPPPPRELDSPAAVLARVASQPGALGYVSYAAVADGPPVGVKIIPVEVDGRRVGPGDPEYPLTD